MLGLAAFLHLLGFYLFHIVSPSPQSSLVSPATLYLLDSDSPQSTSLNAWLESEDSSLFTRTTSSNFIQFPDIPYIPSYSNASYLLVVPQKSPITIPIPLGPSTAPVELPSLLMGD